MFLLKFYGVMDFLSAVVLALGVLNLAPLRPAIGFGLYLLLKGYIYKGDMASFADMGVGVLMIIVSIFGAPGILLVFSVAAIAYLVQKCIMSWVTF